MRVSQKKFTDLPNGSLLRNFPPPAAHHEEFQITY